MKKSYLIAIFGIIFVILTTVFLILSIKKDNWWWFGGLFIFYIIFGIIALIIYLAVQRRKSDEESKIKGFDIETAELINELDDYLKTPTFANMITAVEDAGIVMVGATNKEKTPIGYVNVDCVYDGEKYVYLRNMRDKNKFRLMCNPSKEKTEKAMNELADNPMFIDTVEEVPTTDNLGRPATKKIIKKESQEKIEEKKQQEEKEEEEGLGSGES